MHIEESTAALRSFQQNNAYNNFGHFLTAEGRELPVKVGGTCDILANRFAREYRTKTGVDCRCVWENDSRPDRHIVAITENVLFDTAYFPTCALELETLRRQGELKVNLLPHTISGFVKSMEYSFSPGVEAVDANLCLMDRVQRTFQFSLPALTDLDEPCTVDPLNSVYSGLTAPNAELYIELTRVRGGQLLKYL